MFKNTIIASVFSKSFITLSIYFSCSSTPYRGCLLKVLSVLVVESLMDQLFHRVFSLPNPGSVVVRVVIFCLGDFISTLWELLRNL